MANFKFEQSKFLVDLQGQRSDNWRIVPCFAPGTKIATPKGEQLVQDLKVDDRVLTRDNGIRPIVWTGQRHLTGEELQDTKSIRPVLIRAGSLGPGAPERDLLVSPQHRMLVNSTKAKEHFGEKEVLVPATSMTVFDGVDVVNVPGIIYHHFMLKDHEVVLANGVWSESYQPNDYSLKGVDPAQREELFLVFPELKTKEGVSNFRTARRALKKMESYLLFNK